MLATIDRSWGDRKEELRLEKGDYEGKPTFTLRLHWQGGDGKWRWGVQKPTQSGKCWERLNLKARELRALGQALIEASKQTADQRQSEPRPRNTHPVAINDDDIPF